MVASISYIEKTIETYRAATEVNLTHAARVGNIVVLTPELADEVMITGDLHGHRRNFNLIRSTAALDQQRRRHLVMQEVCHGGPCYPNGGCMSHTMLEDVARLIVAHAGRVHFLLGNHELAELTDYPIQKNRQMLNLLFRLGMQQMYGPAIDKVREAYLPFIRSCPLAVRLPGGVLVCHSIPERADAKPFDPTVFTRALEPAEYLEKQPVFNLVWGRDYRPDNARAFAEQVGAEVIINGHEPCQQGYGTPNTTQVILDSCNDRASYVMLGVTEKLTHAEIVARIRRLK